ncbi:MAG: hemerythrin domain-containing protein [Bacteroidetes bacterium]|nr:hemerythrin domain-containing protein [Bacteroidota bacterium]MBX7130660.1 hemerythrin domain-containing protein [Flavobacteriales bacterium]HMU14802.1 hemerythrin domain-containing protein [Flavobacteriales bacterium]HMZ49897.1 hemerythrin domain-containing protein [Flavobacteriales bacterium]HNE79172.1 hemerythrin domain-containing protein [Flavobacteriales bacterium]
MNEPMTMMLAEHEMIQRAGKTIDALANSWEKDPAQFEQAVRNLVEFFRDYADGFHHRKEEEVLFPALRDHPEFVIPEMIDSLMQHHEEFREYTADIEQALADGDHAQAHKLLTRYMRDLEDHISAENDELFVLAENLLGKKEREDVYFRFMDIDRQLGEDRKKELEELLAAVKVEG